MIVACVRTGEKYGTKYVHRLRSMVAANLHRPHRFVCITDIPAALPDVETYSVSRDLPGWWAKLELFKSDWRAGHRALYLDLDSVVVGDLSPLAAIDAPFGICANFTRAAGNLAWPCRYGSCVMTFGADWGGHVWDAFNADRHGIMARAGRLGDQRAIEELVPDAAILQDRLPAGYFVGYRDLPKHPKPPAGCSVVVFAGNHKPDNTACAWAKQAWAA